MRSASEINKAVQEMCEKHMGNEKAEIATQALAWVLGDDLSPMAMLDDDK